VTFKGETSQVAVDVTDGAGSVTVSGATNYVGTVDAIVLIPSGKVVVSGHGNMSGQSAPGPSAFTITGSCA
jgi:hypothetical protein